MKILFILSFAFLLLPVLLYAEVVTEEQFIVPGQCAAPTTTVVTTPVTTSVPVVTTTPVPTTVVPVTTEQPVYEGMSKAHLLEVMGDPIQVEKFRAHTRRQAGVYDEIYTYPTMVIYIKERRVLKVEYL